MILEGRIYYKTTVFISALVFFLQTGKNGIEFPRWAYFQIMYFTLLNLLVAVAGHSFIWVGKLILSLNTSSVNKYQAILTILVREPSLYVRI